MLGKAHDKIRRHEVEGRAKDMLLLGRAICRAKGKALITLLVKYNYANPCLSIVGG